MSNESAPEPSFETVETPRGVWRSCRHPRFGPYNEFSSHRRLFGQPLFHYASGRDPWSGRRATARGIIAVGRRAIGIVAIGQWAFGVVTVGQFAPAVLVGLGQFTCGLVALGQFAVAPLFAAGQFSAGAIAIGQFAAGYYALGQQVFAVHGWDVGGADPSAEALFERIRSVFRR
jgi:hypothetical protein